MSELMDDFDKALAECRQEVAEYFDDLGQRAEDSNKAEGSYHDRTGFLRRSNYHRADADGLDVGNSADYASNVESRGYNVIDSGTKLIMEELA